MEAPRTKLDPKIIKAPTTMKSFTDEQLQLLQKFKAGPAKDYIKEGTHDLDLTRWLSARKWNVDAATTMFINSMKWREQVRADHILEEFPQSPYFKLLQEYWPSSVDSQCSKKPENFRTLDGHQFYIDRFASIDTAVLDYFPREVLYRHRIYVQEIRALERQQIFEETGEYAATTAISDLGDLSFSHLTGTIMTQVQDVTKMDNDNYPETMRKAFIVNTPSIFSSLWGMASHLWEEDQKNKMMFIGKDFKDEVLAVVDPKYVPKEFGGTCEWELPKGGPLKNLNLDWPKDTRNWEKVTVGRSDKFKKTIKLEAGAVISWEFKTKGYDISFGINQDDRVILPVEKVESNVRTIFGSLKIETSGDYQFVWDNSSSWARSKDLEFILIQK